MNIRYFKILLVLAFLTVAGFAANASSPVLYQYGFENLPGNGLTAASPWTGTPDVLATGLSNSSWATSYTGFVSYDGSCGNSACQALSISHNNYPTATTYTLTFTVAAGKEISISGLSFWDRESNTGPKTADITINGIAAVTTHTLAGINGGNSGALTLLNPFVHLTGNITLLVTLNGATSTSGTFRLDDFVINGSVNTPGINNYNVTGGGNLCIGDSGLVLGLDGSDTGVTYQLKDAGNANVGQPVAGTGSAISFGLQTGAGTYTVLASNDTGATGVMLGSATIVIKQTPVVTLPSVAPQCGGSVTLDAGNAGDTFLWSDNSAQQTDIVGVTGSYSVVVTDTNGCSASASVSVTINTAPSLSFSATNLTICTGQPSTITVNGASTYIWSNNLTTASITVQPDTSSTYSVVATDTNGCTANGSASLNVIPAVRDTVSIQLCPGLSYNGHNASGTFSDTLAASGGCDSIVTLYLQVFAVNNTITAQTICAGQSFQGHSSSGTFADTLTSYTGCDSILTLQLTVTSAIVNTISQTVCYSDSFNGYNASGTYNDTLQAVGGCDSVVSLTLTVLPKIITVLRDSICHGDTVMGHTSSGTFTDTLVAAGGCDSLVTLHLTVHSLPYVSLTLTFDTVCSNATSITLSGGTPAGGYYSGLGVSHDSVFTPSSAPLGSDTIDYNYTDSNGCFRRWYSTAYTEVCTDSTDTTVAIKNIINPVFRILPNPAQDYLTIENTGSETPGTVSLYDLLGRMILTQPLETGPSAITTLHIRQLPAGLYLINITQSGGKVSSFRIVKD